MKKSRFSEEQIIAVLREQAGEMNGLPHLRCGSSALSVREWVEVAARLQLRLAGLPH